MPMAFQLVPFLVTDLLDDKWSCPLVFAFLLACSILCIVFPDSVPNLICWLGIATVSTIVCVDLHLLSLQIVDVHLIIDASLNF